MQIFIIIKCGLQDSFNFISQIAGINDVKKIVVFRDTVSLSHAKVEYILPAFTKVTILKLLGRLVQILTRWKYKPAVIVGIYELPHGLLSVLAGKILRIPSAVSIIGNPAYTKLRKGFRNKLTLWIIRNSNFVTVTGNNSKHFLVSKGIPERKVFVLPNTLDFTQFNKLSNAVKKYDLISLGRISEEKQVELIIKIVAILRDKKSSFKAAIAGSGPELDHIINLVSKMGLEQNVEILGFIPDEQLEAFYNSGHIFVLTSETEGFPRTIIQAAACGTPVISSNVGDIADIIEDGINGFLVNQYDNVEEYSEKILQLLDDDILYNQFSEKLMQKVHKEFSVECASRVWQKIISEIP